MEEGRLVKSLATLYFGELGVTYRDSKGELRVRWFRNYTTDYDSRIHTDLTDQIEALGFRRDGNFNQGWNAAMEEMKQFLTTKTI